MPGRISEAAADQVHQKLLFSELRVKFEFSFTFKTIYLV